MRGFWVGWGLIRMLMLLLLDDVHNDDGEGRILFGVHDGFWGVMSSCI